MGHEPSDVALRFVHDFQPGLRRERAGAGFIYLDENGARIEDRAVLDRIRGLVIPPAWSDRLDLSEPRCPPAGDWGR